MKSPSAELLAKIGIFVQFMALVRCLFEYFRLKSVHGGTLIIAAVEPFIAGSLIAALGAWIAVVCFFLRWYKTAVVVAVGTVVILAWLQNLLSALNPSAPMPVSAAAIRVATRA